MIERANETIFDEIHGLQAQVLRDYLKAVKDNPELITPALIAQVNKFLKDNGIDRPVKPGDAEDLLSDELDEFEQDNVLPFG
jgi:hypothetical protein